MNELKGEFHFPSGKEDSSEESDARASETTSKPDDGKNLPPPHTAEAKEENVAVKKKVSFYTSLSEYPVGVSFDTQDADEEIILLVRRSFLTNVPWIFVIALFALLPLIIIFLPLPPAIFENISFLTYIVGLFFFYLILFGVAIVNFSLWYFHVGLVTNKRVVDVDLHGILSRHVAETRISLVQDVSYKQVGFLRSLFQFGDVFVQTAGSKQNIQFDRVPRPRFVAQVVGDMIGKPYHKVDK